MIARERFVYVHQPKTGGTFVTAALKLLPRPPRPPALRRRLDRLLGKAAPKPRKHGTCRDVPDAWRDRILVATVRNPFDRYVSQYEFGWWKGNARPWIDADALRRRFPAYPELTFPEYLEAAVDGFQRTPCPGLPPERRPGLQTEQFLWYYFRDPSRAMAALDDAYIRERRWEADMFPVRFLRVENLNRDLHDFLLEAGEPADRVAPILEMGRVLPAGSGKRKGRPWREYWTPDLLARVAPRERLLLAMFPEYAP